MTPFLKYCMVQPTRHGLSRSAQLIFVSDSFKTLLMTQENLKPEHRRFLLQNIDSVSKLEVLLLIFRSPSTPMDAVSVSNALRSNPGAISQQLKELATAGLIQASADGKTYTFTLANQPIVEEIAELYRTHPFSVIETIYAGPTERIRSFADSFILKKEKK